jgi:nitrogen-specific signal transduction histidine kinase
LAVLSFGRDVTLRKRAERSRLQADRLSALGLLAGGMAHALNNPLTYVVLNLDHVQRRLPLLAYDSAELADMMARLAEAREGAERMATIVRRMRNFARADESSTRPLDLRHVLESVVELVGHEVHHRGRLTTHFENVPQVVANESKLEQICLGLLLFAAQMLPDDAPLRHAVRLNLESDERHFAVLEIVCEGCELDASMVEQLFDPFAQGGESSPKGFGLSVCSSLIEQLGGHLVAEPLPGTGLLLRTTIPCLSVPRPSESSLTSRPPSSVPGLRRGRARLLLVDDDPGVGKALHQLLEGEHDVKCFESPQAALQELLNERGYDLVFCDLMMPKLSGMDLFEVLRYNRPGYEAKLVFMTGGAFTPAATRFLAQVPNQRIEKPFSLSILQRLIQRALRKHD